VFVPSLGGVSAALSEAQCEGIGQINCRSKDLKYRPHAAALAVAASGRFAYDPTTAVLYRMSDTWVKQAGEKFN
jgi:hypothetical protein